MLTLGYFLFIRLMHATPTMKRIYFDQNSMLNNTRIEVPTRQSSLPLLWLHLDSIHSPLPNELFLLDPCLCTHRSKHCNRSIGKMTKFKFKCLISIRFNFCRSVPPELLRSFFYVHRANIHEVSLHSTTRMVQSIRIAGIKGVCQDLCAINFSQQCDAKSFSFSPDIAQSPLQSW